MPLKTIIFDLGRVIVPFDFERGYRGMQPYCSYPASEIPDRLRASGLTERFESGHMDAREFFEEMSKALELRMPYGEFRAVWSSVFLPETLVPDAFVGSLKDRYRLLLLSNTNSIHFEMIHENYPILRHFDEFVLSYRVGAMKPSPVIYREAIARAGCEPAECFFTDDVPAYVAGARKEGIDAVLFEGYDSLRTALAERGVEV